MFISIGKMFVCYIVSICNCPIRLRVWSRKSQPRLPNSCTPSCAIYAVNKSFQTKFYFLRNWMSKISIIFLH